MELGFKKKRTGDTRCCEFEKCAWRTTVFSIRGLFLFCVGLNPGGCEPRPRGVSETREEVLGRMMESAPSPLGQARPLQTRVHTSMTLKRNFSQLCVYFYSSAMHTDTYTRSEVPRGRLSNGTAILKRCLSHLRWGCFCGDMRPAAWPWKRENQEVSVESPRVSQPPPLALQASVFLTRAGWDPLVRADHLLCFSRRHLGLFLHCSPFHVASLNLCRSRVASSNT